MDGEKPPPTLSVEKESSRRGRFGGTIEWSGNAASSERLRWGIVVGQTGEGAKVVHDNVHDLELNLEL